MTEGGKSRAVQTMANQGKQVRVCMGAAWTTGVWREVSGKALAELDRNVIL